MSRDTSERVIHRGFVHRNLLNAPNAAGRTSLHEGFQSCAYVQRFIGSLSGSEFLTSPAGDRPHSRIATRVWIRSWYICMYAYT